jgi:hypothetical protein
MDDREIVGDQEHAHAELVSQMSQKVRDLGLHRYVESGERLVEDDDGGSRGQRPGERDPLALASAELEGEALGNLGRQADALEQRLDGELCPVALLRPAHAVGHLVAHAPTGVEGAVGILKNHLQADVLDRALARVKGTDGPAVEVH